MLFVGLVVRLISLLDVRFGWLAGPVPLAVTSSSLVYCSGSLVF